MQSVQEELLKTGASERHVKASAEVQQLLTVVEAGEDQLKAWSDSTDTRMGTAATQLDHFAELQNASLADTASSISDKLATHESGLEVQRGSIRGLAKALGDQARSEKAHMDQLAQTQEFVTNTMTERMVELEKTSADVDTAACVCEEGRQHEALNSTHDSTLASSRSIAWGISCVWGDALVWEET